MPIDVSGLPVRANISARIPLQSDWVEWRRRTSFRQWCSRRCSLWVLSVLLATKCSTRSLDTSKLAVEGYDDMPLRSVMAMLVHHTYFRDLNSWEGVAAWLSDYTNKRANDYGNLHWEVYECEASESELKDLGLAFLRRNNYHRNPNAPSLAIVLRGTIPTRKLDMFADIRIGVERVNESERVLRTVRLILEVVEKFQYENPGRNERICMAGHSLGAAIALIVGGYLYSTHDIDIDTHLFNPPLLTLVDVLRGHAPPAQVNGHDVPCLKVDFFQLKEALVGDQAGMLDEWEQFRKLQYWIPHFYLNPGDLFCFQYIEFYQNRQGRPVRTPGDVISVQGIFSSGLASLFKRDAKYFKNVVPSADLYVSNWKCENLRLAHSLRQWHKYRPAYIALQDVYEARLLPQRHRQQGRH